jgi:site-specific DNA-methyltransferase (adenine-specific)
MQDIQIKDKYPHCSKHVLPLVVGGLTISCEDNMELMSRYPDNYFDLAIVDPPYGISYARGKNGFGDTTKNLPKLKDVSWDNSIPAEEYFNELKRVSKNQVIWGGNYFTEYLNPTNSWIVWDKIADMKLENPFSDCELAWTSYNKVMTKITLRQQGFISDSKDGKRIHPTQKPSELYKWILNKHAKPNDKILDTHLGSGSIAIACHDYKYELTACELDPEYFEKAKQRIINHVAQQSLF